MHCDAAGMYEKEIEREPPRRDGRREGKGAERSVDMDRVDREDPVEGGVIAGDVAGVMRSTASASLPTLSAMRPRGSSNISKRLKRVFTCRIL
ncbi:hypothetical protein DPX16_18796 [Anabarilius grahami]|uniref:Uncharacterized protein n=1 Tax=Anabarilius grahami TaxID=495550 RepID=A0A3N0Y235_ANAGA|nr:hypothetical protein DPX16_18796 [Anabarilius grahami]